MHHHHCCGWPAQEVLLLDAGRAAFAAERQFGTPLLPAPPFASKVWTVESLQLLSLQAEVLVNGFMVACVNSVLCSLLWWKLLFGLLRTSVGLCLLFFYLTNEQLMPSR